MSPTGNLGNNVARLASILKVNLQKKPLPKKQ